jgi:peptidoglycan hydrolase CwlO-like protein
MVWTDFVELRNHVEGVFESSTQEAMNAHQELQFQVKGTTKNITAMQAQFTTFQQSIDQLTQSIAALRNPVAPPPL